MTTSMRCAAAGAGEPGVRPGRRSCRASAARTAPDRRPAAVALGEAPFAPAMETYYQTDPISRASPTMAECAATFAPVALAAE